MNGQREAAEVTRPLLQAEWHGHDRAKELGQVQIKSNVL